MADSMNLTGLSTYVNEISNDIIPKLILAAPSTQYTMGKPDCYGATEVINWHQSALAAQSCAGSITAWTTSGSQAFDNAQMTMADRVFTQNFENEALRTYWLTYKTKGLKNDNIPFEQYLIDQMAIDIANINEKMLWQGRTTSSDPNLQGINGWLYAASASLTMVTPNAATQSISTSTIDTIITAMVGAIPSDQLYADDLHLYMGADTFNTALNKYFSSNYSHLNTADWGSKKEFMVPGAIPIKAVCTPGLNGTNKMLLTRKVNMWYGYLVDEPTRVGAEAWYDPNTLCGTYKVRFKERIGAQILWGDKIVSNFITTI